MLSYQWEKVQILLQLKRSFSKILSKFYLERQRGFPIHRIIHSPGCPGKEKSYLIFHLHRSDLFFEGIPHTGKFNKLKSSFSRFHTIWRNTICQ